MTATGQRILSGDPVKRSTWRYQQFLARFRALGGDSSDPTARYMRSMCRQARGLPRREERE